MRAQHMPATAFLTALTCLGVTACAARGADPSSRTDLGFLASANADGSGSDEMCVTLTGDQAIEPMDARTFTATSLTLEAELRVDSGVSARLSVDGESQLLSAETTQAVIHASAAAATEWTVTVENLDESAVLNGTLCVRSAATDPAAPISPALRAAALANLERVANEIDYRSHLRKYGLQEAPDGTPRSVPEQFLLALEEEYASQPEMLRARMTALASMVFFAAPEIEPVEEGRTPFHGLDSSQFEEIMSIEDSVWSHHRSGNGGSKIGLRPFSVCETRYIIDQYVRAGVSYTDYDSYKSGLDPYVTESCSEEDLAYWYNYRGLGHLRPTWIESNIMERVVRRMVGECDGGEIKPEWTEECAQWHADRFAYRNRVNHELSSRFWFYDPADEDFLASPGNAAALFEDVTGDGVGEFVRNGPTTLREDGSTVTLRIESTGQFSGRFSITEADGTSRNVAPGDVVYETSVNPAFDPSWWGRPDFGLQTLFADPNPTGGEHGCLSETPDPAQCPLLKRFYAMIDRHENFYQTYSALRPTYNGRFSLSSQPSPLVACSVTLRAAHHWDHAGTPSGGNAGFIFLMRVPFAQILTGSNRSISSLPEAPRTLNIQDLYAGTQLDMSRVWVDIASLSNDLYSGENEISKYGAVPAEQVEGLLVIRRPSAMDAAGAPEPM